MVSRLRNLCLSGLLAVIVSVAVPVTPAAFAAYNDGAYGACAYNTGDDCDTPTNPSPNSAQNTNTVPNTGLQYVSLVWPVVTGLLGLSIISFVLIRYFNSAKTTNS